LTGLQQQRQGLQRQLAAAAAGAYQQMSAALGATSTGVPLPADLPALAEELVVLQGVRQYLAYVQELQTLVRHLDKTVRTLLQQAAAGSVAGSAEAAALLQALGEAVDGFSNAVGYAIAVQQLTEQGKVPIQRLQQQAASLLARVDSVQQGLRSLLSSALQQRLAAAHWPPPLAVSGEGGPAAAGAPERERR
jgi:phage tail tape-measure protein